MRSALEVATANIEHMGLGKFDPFTYAAPFAIAGWQRQLDRAYPRGPHHGRLLVRWEPGDPWQPINRLFLWQAVDPRYVTIQPFVLKELQGPAPRSPEGAHFCGDGYCFCPMKRNRYVDTCCTWIDTHTHRIYRETGLYATRWWVIQGNQGGHRYVWDKKEAASLIAEMKTGSCQPPAAGDLPFAPFDNRVLRAIRREHIASRLAMRLKDLDGRKASLRSEERDEAERVAKALWDWTGQTAEDLWNDGADMLPNYFEEQYGRAPVGHKVTTDYEAIEERALTVALD